MRTAAELAKMINTNIGCIINALNQKDIDSYWFLESNYVLLDVSTDEQYRRRFRGYYIMRYTAQEYVHRFFELFQRQKMIRFRFSIVRLAGPLMYADMAE